MKADESSNLLQIEQFMETLGVAEAFYGEMYGNEHRMVHHNVALRKEDGNLWIGRYGDREGNILIPTYELKAKPRDEDYLSTLKHPVAVSEPSILIVYGEKFLAMVEAVDCLPEIFHMLSTQDNVCETRYEGFRGFIGTYREFKALETSISELLTVKLYDFFREDELENFPKVLPLYDLWKSTSHGYFSETEKMALDNACRILNEPEREEDFLSFAAVHCEHNEGASYDAFRTRLNELLRRSEEPAR